METVACPRVALRFLLAVLLAGASVAAQAQACYETTIRSPNPYLGNGGETILMMDGTVWTEHSYQYLYLYEYYPTVTLCPSRGIMLLNGKRFQVSRVASKPVPAAKESKSSVGTPSQSTPDVIESSIDGDFEGWDGETVFKLMNGQIWIQDAYAYTYHYAYSPRVLIVNVRGRYVMQVDGMSEKVVVRRLR